MLPAALALAALLTATPPAHAEDGPRIEVIKAEGVPIRVHLEAPERGHKGWEYLINDRAETKITLRRPFHTPPFVGVGGHEVYQPDLAGASDADIIATLRESVPGTGDVPDDATVEHTEHEKHGPLVVVSYTDPGEDEAPDLDLRVVLLPVEAGYGFLVGTHLAGRDGLVQGIDEVLDMMEVPRPAVSPDTFVTGHYVSEAGYELDIPEGWRSLTDSELGILTNATIELGPFKGKPSSAVFVKPSLATGDLEDAPTMSCLATAAEIHPLELIDPAKSGAHEANFKARARVFLRKGTFTDSTGERVSLNRVDTAGGIPVMVEKESEGPVEFLQLGDREAYYMESAGTFMEKPIRAASFYTTWDDIGLDCGTFAHEDDTTTIPAFKQSISSVRVLDGASHPTYLSFMTRYKRWWPWTHPALQLYWLPIPIFLLGIVLAMRGD